MCVSETERERERRHEYILCNRSDFLSDVINIFFGFLFVRNF